MPNRDFCETLRGLLEKATPGPWKYVDAGHNEFIEQDRKAGRMIAALPDIYSRKADFLAIIALRNRADAILKVVEAARLSKLWIEREEGFTLDNIVAIDDRAKQRGEIAWNEQFATMCRALHESLAALDNPPSAGKE